jgi:hypothetical protein
MIETGRRKARSFIPQDHGVVNQRLHRSINRGDYCVLARRFDAHSTHGTRWPKDCKP